MRDSLPVTYVAKFYGPGWSWAWFMAAQTFAIFTLWSQLGFGSYNQTINNKKESSARCHAIIFTKIFLSSCTKYLLSSKYFPMPIIFILLNFKATRRKSRKINYRQVCLTLPYFGVKLSCVCLMFADRKQGQKDL